MPTPDSLARYIAFQPNSTAPLRLFCFPNAGGGVAVLHGWLKGLPSSIQVCPLQLPGRENRRLERPFNRMDPLVGELADAIEPFLDRDFTFFGHSLGALVAFEVARELRRRNRRVPSQLFASARVPPQERIILPPIHALTEAQFISELQHRYNAIPDVILADRELMTLYLPVLRADLEIIEKYLYQPEEPLACPISVFGGTEDPTISAGQLKDWRLQTSGAFRLRMFPGDHFFPKTSREKFVEAIAEDLRAVIDGPYK
jgi:medium-chain acyl-[acyl-carrier-protein] hydrolase